MENHTFGEVIGNPSAPYTTALAHGCATATNYRAVGSPSLPNYIGMTSGSTQGIDDDAAPGGHPLTVDNLFRQVRGSGESERSYEEAMPSPCTLSSSGKYAVKHNPAAYYVGQTDRAACQHDDVPFDRFVADLGSGTLPAFSLVTPNLCDDTHDCGVATGDRWLASWAAHLLASGAYATGRTVVFIVWDEYTPMPFVAVAPSVVPGTVVGVAVDHYSLLRTTEELLGLSLLGHAATAVSLRPALSL